MEKNKVKRVISEAFMDTPVSKTMGQQEVQMGVNMEKQDFVCKMPQEAQRSVVQTTLDVASSAASLILFPYVFVGKTAMHATSTVLKAPLCLTNQVRVSLVQSWTRSSRNHVRTELLSDDSTSDTSDVNSNDELLPAPFAVESMITKGENYRDVGTGVVSQLLHLPVQLVHSSVATAVAIPTRVVTYNGQKVSDAVWTSHAFATSAIVASTGGVARTGMHVARGITNGAVSTASFTVSIISGAMNVSVRSVNYVMPPSVSNVIWQGMDITGNASVNVLSHAIAVPSYRILQALIPAVSSCFSEKNMVNETRGVVKTLVRLLGPQNAFYLVKWVYETVNSEEALDIFLLCRDILNESLDGENYRIVGASMSAVTGVNKVMHMMKETYAVLPSFDELLDVAVLVADISDEVVDGIANAVAPERTLDSCDECRSGPVNDDDELTDPTFACQESTLLSTEDHNSLFESSLSLMAQACDCEEVSSLFNTFGDFLDVLVN